jgi:GNAT superfamily N-acetyltransferase
MGISEALAEVILARDDVPAALLLSDEAGWNQTADDWRFFIESGHTLGLRTADGKLVATGAALPYSGDLGFVSMVLVTAAWRRRGLATRLLDALVAFLRHRGLTPVLDATPAGATVYAQHGFRQVFPLERWNIPARISAHPQLPLNITTEGDIDRIAGLDAAAFGANRRPLLHDFLSRPQTEGLLTTDGAGFALIRDGRRARQIGPIVASNVAQALELVKTVAARLERSAFIDVPSAWTTETSWIAAHGGKLQRPFLRMAYGSAGPFGDTARLFAVAGPEFG